MQKQWYKWRLWGYILGFALFYAPLAWFQRGLLWVMGKNYEPTIHNLCFRIPIEHLLDGKLLGAFSLAAISTALLLILAIVFGPLFCGRLCPSGALGEYLSRLLPVKWQISWGEYLPVAYIRQGLLVGFMLAPFFGGLLACAYCNFFVFDLLLNFWFWGYAISFTSSLLLTMLLYLLIFGLFTKGGRGFCAFFCPVGAFQSALHFWGRKVPWFYKLKFRQDKCCGCKICLNNCPMQALSYQQDKIVYNSQLCILCGDCTKHCPTKAISYGRGKEK